MPGRCDRPIGCAATSPSRARAHRETGQSSDDQGWTSGYGTGERPCSLSQRAHAGPDRLTKGSWMTEQQILVALGGIGAAALLCQWLAWRVRLPAILFLLLSGILAGPVLGWL